MTNTNFLQRDPIKAILSEKILASIVKAASTLPKSKMGDLEFSAFQQSILNGNLHNFDYQFCATSTISLSEKGAISDLITVNLNLPDEIVASYLMHQELDELSPLVYANPGRALNYTYICRQELVEKHPFFINHCHKFGIHHAISVGYLHPGHLNTFIAFDYMGGKRENTWVPFSHVKIELASFPFVLAWLYRKQIFDIRSLEKKLFLLEGLTETKFLNLRKYINSPQQTLLQQANDLGIKPGTLKDDLSKIRNTALKKLGFEEEQTKSTPMRVLDEHFGYLRMLGDHTASLIAVGGAPHKGAPP